MAIMGRSEATQRHIDASRLEAESGMATVEVRVLLEEFARLESMLADDRESNWNKAEPNTILAGPSDGRVS